MESYIGGQTDDSVLNLDSVVDADTVSDALTALQEKGQDDGYALVCQVTDVDPGNSAAYEDITVSSDFKAVVLDGTLLISYWWDEENKVEYTIYRGVEKEGDYDLFATADEETFYAFTWGDYVDKTKAFTMEELEEKYVVTFTEDAHAPQMCMNSIT